MGRYIKRYEGIDRCCLCETALNGKNWPISQQKHGSRLCQDCHNKRCAAWYQANKDRLKNHFKERGRLYEISVKQAALESYGSICKCCGESLFEFLTLDHIGGRVRGHEIDSLRGVHLYRWLKKNNYPKDLHLRVLCFNCNLSIGAYGYCPHTKTNSAELSGRSNAN